MKNFDILLYGITDRGLLKDGKPLSEAVRAALEGGITLLQLREKNIPYEEFLKSAREILPICHEYGVPLIINDNVRICIEADADGVHLGQGDMSITEARKLLGDDKIIGITAKTVEQALNAQNGGADYIGSGAIFGTSTKKDAIKMDMETLKKITSSVTMPVAAIGGIDISNVDKLAGTGISGAAVVSGIFGNEDITCATRELRKKTESILR